MVTWASLGFVTLVMAGIVIGAFGLLYYMAAMMSDTGEVNRQGCGTLVTGVALIIAGVLGLVL